MLLDDGLDQHGVTPIVLDQNDPVGTGRGRAVVSRQIVGDDG